MDNDDLEGVDEPRCPNCLNLCIVAGTERHPYWLCPGCRTPVLA